jgi:hypothetical protein
MNPNDLPKRYITQHLFVEFTAMNRREFRREAQVRFSIRRTLRAWATITSCPNSLNKRLTHGECIPVSSAIRCVASRRRLPSLPSAL